MQPKVQHSDLHFKCNLMIAFKVAMKENKIILKPIIYKGEANKK